MALYGNKVYYNAARNLSPMATPTGRWLDCTTRGNSLFIQNNYYGGCGCSCGCGGGFWGNMWGGFTNFCNCGYGYLGNMWGGFTNLCGYGYNTMCNMWGGFMNFCGCGCGCGGFWNGIGNAFMGGLSMGIANGIMGLCNMGVGMFNNWLSGGYNLGCGYGNYNNGTTRTSDDKKVKTPKVKIEYIDRTDKDYTKLNEIGTRINNLTETSSDDDIKQLVKDIKTAQGTPDSDNISADDNRTHANNLINDLSNKLATLGKQFDENDDGNISIKAKAAPENGTNVKTADELIANITKDYGTLGAKLSTDKKSITFENLNILFDQAKYDVKNNDDAIKNIMAIASDPQYKGLIRAIRITGYTNIDGDGKYDNEGLGAKRADAVRTKMKDLDTDKFSNIPAIETNNEWNNRTEGTAGSSVDRHAKIEILLW